MVLDISEKEMTELETVDFIKTSKQKVVGLAEAYAYALKNGGTYRTSVWCCLDGTNATAWSLYAPDKKIRFKMHNEDALTDLSALGIKEKVYVWRDEFCEGLLACISNNNGNGVCMEMPASSRLRVLVVPPNYLDYINKWPGQTAFDISIGTGVKDITQVNQTIHDLETSGKIISEVVHTPVCEKGLDRCGYGCERRYWPSVNGVSE